jgi:hypothetical protein
MMAACKQLASCHPFAFSSLLQARHAALWLRVNESIELLADGAKKSAVGPAVIISIAGSPLVQGRGAQSSDWLRTPVIIINESVVLGSDGC